MKRFPISWLHTQAYCEYQLKLKYIDKKKPKYSPAMAKGAARHDQLEKQFLEEATELEEPFEDYLAALLKGERDPIILREEWVESKEYGVYGKFDEAQLFPDAAVIIDDKPGETAYTSNKRQVWAYALCFKEKYNWPKKMVAVLRNRDSQEVFWEKDFTKKDEEDVLKAIQRVHGLFAGEIEWIPTKIKNKCKACSFNKVCDRSLVK